MTANHQVVFIVFAAFTLYVTVASAIVSREKRVKKIPLPQAPVVPPAPPVVKKSVPSIFCFPEISESRDKVYDSMRTYRVRFIPWPGWAAQERCVKANSGSYAYLTFAAKYLNTWPNAQYVSVEMKCKDFDTGGTFWWNLWEEHVIEKPADSLGTYRPTWRGCSNN